MADLATLQTRLTEAEGALHDLVMGRKAVQVSFPDNSAVTFSEFDMPQLREYIGDLRRQIAALSGTASQVFTIQSRRGLQQ
jgi:hypothetical protein